MSNASPTIGHRDFNYVRVPCIVGNDGREWYELDALCLAVGLWTAAEALPHLDAKHRLDVDDPAMGPRVFAHEDFKGALEAGRDDELSGRYFDEQDERNAAADKARREATTGSGWNSHGRLNP